VPVVKGRRGVGRALWACLWVYRGGDRFGSASTVEVGLFPFFDEVGESLFQYVRFRFILWVPMYPCGWGEVRLAGAATRGATCAAGSCASACLMSVCVACVARGCGVGHGVPAYVATVVPWVFCVRIRGRLAAVAESVENGYGPRVHVCVFPVGQVLSLGVSAFGASGLEAGASEVCDGVLPSEEEFEGCQVPVIFCQVVRPVGPEGLERVGAGGGSPFE
jgi:hypothetical protein